MNLIAQIFWHAVFMVNVTGFVTLVVWSVCRKFFASDPRGRTRFIRLTLLIIVIKIMYILAFTTMAPERVLSTDGGRYLNETQQIAKEPWRWNPITGEGPHYSKSAKMGMSYLYGTILFVHRIDSLYAVLVLNVLFSYLTCVTVLLLTLRITSSITPAFVAMFMTAVYPETIYWNARVVRENLTLLLVPLFVYFCIRLRETYRLRYFAFVFALTMALMVTRVQLTLFLPLVLFYFAAVSVLQQDRVKVLVITALIFIPAYLGYGFLRMQIKQAVGSDLLQYITLSPSFWLREFTVFLRTAPQLLSVFARQHGLLGVLLGPVFIMVMLLLVLTFVNFGRIFKGHKFAAGLMLFLTSAFIFVVASFGLVNIRFRATVSPLVLSLVSVTTYHYWKRLGLPTITLRLTRRGGG